MATLADCTVYIDESGDLGVGKGTRWFVITAVIVERMNEGSIRSIVRGIKNKLNLQVIHFKDIREFNKKVYIASAFHDLPFTLVNVIVDTNTLELKNSALTYNYLSRILLERVSWFLRDHNLRADVIFSSRNTRRDNELTEYLSKKVLNYEWNNIANGTILSVKSEKMERLDLLQFADVCAASMHKLHEPDRFGFTYPCFMNNLKTHLYTYKGSVYKYGIKYYRDEMQPDPDYFDMNAPCDYLSQKNKKPPERT